MKQFQPKLLAGLLAASLVVVGLTGCNKADAVKVATVNGVVVSKTQYDEVYDQLLKKLGLESSAQVEENDVLKNTLKQMTLNKLIVNALVDAGAKESGIKISKEEISTFKTEQMDKLGGQKVFDALLTQHNLSEEEFDETLRRQLVMNKLIEKNGGSDIQVTEAEAKKYYDANKKEFDVPEQIRSKHILLKVVEPEIKRELQKKDPKISFEKTNEAIETLRAEKKAKAEEILKQVKADPAKFEELAKKNSEDLVSGANGGDLGYMQEGYTEKSFWEALKKGKTNALYPTLVESVFGYHVIFVQDKQKPHRLTFGEAKKELSARLEDQKKQMFLNKWMNDQQTTASIEIEEAFKPQEVADSGAGTDISGGAQQAPQQPQAQQAAPAKTH
ncbi:MAG: SurA N-terminal domain-containing protein [Vampirovibrio sp.]|nr:SurA N-terminal domain-containing protein [Vampirovibrio sp.]